MMNRWACPLPLQDYPGIVIGHGGGGKLSAELVEHLFLPAFRNDTLENLGDSSILSVPTGRLAFSTDSFVVKPLFFPGGSIGDLAVNGTINDISMSGARPLLPQSPASSLKRVFRILARPESAPSARPRGGAESRSSPATPRSSKKVTATAAISTPPESASSPTASASARPSRNPAMLSS